MFTKKRAILSKQSRKIKKKKKTKHEPSGWAMFTKLCKKFKERAMKITNYEEKK